MQSFRAEDAEGKIGVMAAATSGDAVLSSGADGSFVGSSRGRMAAGQAAAYLVKPLGADGRAVVPALVPAVIPNDSGFGSQWHLRNTSYPGVDLNVTEVWDEYRGAGVTVGVVDTGIDYLHSDLSPNYRHDLDYDALDGDADAFASASFDDHGTAVSGVIAAAINGTGAVGVAPEAGITGYRIGFGSSCGNVDTADLVNRISTDVVNNSWGYDGFFYDDFGSPDFRPIGAAIENQAANGRGGLGTIITFAAGNSGDIGDDVNYHSFQNSPYTIAVGAIASDGAITSFSTPGAAVLVSAPGSGIYTTDVRGSGGYASGDFITIDGTSFSSPAVAGVAALMLDANPDLGYRDVQEILAYSAVNPSSSTAGWQTNGAFTWNGGGLTVSHDYGFGLADAHAARAPRRDLDDREHPSQPGHRVGKLVSAPDHIRQHHDHRFDHAPVGAPHRPGAGGPGHLPLLHRRPHGEADVSRRHLQHAGQPARRIAVEHLRLQPRQHRLHLQQRPVLGRDRRGGPGRSLSPIPRSRTRGA